MARACDKVFDSFELSGIVPTSDQFRDSFSKEIGKPSRAGKSPTNGFFDVFDLFVSTMGAQNAWTKGTFKKFKSIKAHLEAFDPDLSFELLTNQTMQSFVDYQMKVDLRNTSINKYMGFVRWFLRWSENNGYYKGRVHETYRAKLKGTDGNNKEIIFLSWDELIHVYNLDFNQVKRKLEDGTSVPLEQVNIRSLERVRDVFCFCCFTGLRYSDVAKLSRSDIREGHISVVTLKTVDALKIELNNYSRAILEKYADFPFKKDRALPVTCNVNMNLVLKDLGELAGLKEPQRIVYFKGNVRHEEVYPKYELLTTHCGRRTFVVNALTLGIAAETIMKWTGHSDFKSMKPYMQIVDSLKAQEMNKFNK